MKLGAYLASIQADTHQEVSCLELARLSFDVQNGKTKTDSEPSLPANTGDKDSCYNQKVSSIKSHIILNCRNSQLDTLGKR